MRTNRLRSLVLLATLAAGCGGGSHPAQSDAGRPPECTRDPALLAAAAACARDDQCPCGAYCGLGLCTHDCLTDADCDGWCDANGRCRDAADTSAVPPVSAPAVGDLRLSADHLTYYAFTQQSAFVVGAGRAALPDVRVAADDGLTLDCFGTPARECELGALAVGDEVQVTVTPTANGPIPDGVGVAVYAGDTMRRVAVTTATTASPTAPQPGVYRGMLAAERADAALLGAQPRTPEPLGAALRHLEIPVEVRVYADGTIAFVDGLAALGKPAAAGQPFTWSFHLAPDGRFDAVAGGADWSRHALVGRAAATTDTTAADVGAAGRGSVMAVGATLQGTLEVAVDGLGPIYAPTLLLDERPTTTWRFLVTRAADLGAGETPPALGGGTAPAFGPGADRYAHPLPFEPAVTTAVGSASLGWAVDATPATRLQYYLCYDHSAGLASVPMVTSTASLTPSGDLRCQDAGGTAPWRAAFPFFTNADRGANALNSSFMLRECQANLGRVLGAVPGTVPAGAAGLDVLSGCGNPCDPGTIPDCVDGPLVLRALGLGLDAVARTGMPDMVAWPPLDADGTAAARLAHRVLQQWIQTLTFVARESRQSSNVLLGGQPQDLAAALDTSLAAWDVVLHPRVMGRLLHLPADVLRAPDYRGDATLAADMTEDHTQPVGLPVALVEGLRAQLEAAQQATVRARFAGAHAAPAQVGATLRYVVVLYPLAELLHARAVGGGTAPPWEDQWQTASAGLLTALRDLLAQARALDAGANPLGVDDDDLPLYRDASSPTDPGQRFSAVSSYLIGGWAEGAVADATAAKAAAQAAWQALLERPLQLEVDTAAREERLAELRRSYGEKILTMCGNPQNLAAEDVLATWPDLRATTCFLNKANPACSYDEKELVSKLTLDDVSYQLCYATTLQLKMGSRAALDSATIQPQIDALVAQLKTDYDPGSLDFWGRLDTGVVSAGWDALREINNVTNGIPSGVTQQLQSMPSFAMSSTADADAVAESVRECKAQFPGAVTLTERVESLQSSPLDRPDCYQGSLGELALTVRAAAKDVDVAKSALQDYTDAYGKAMRQCTLADDALAQIAGIEQNLDAIEAKLGAYQNLLNGCIDGVSQAAQVESGIVAAAAGGDPGTLTSSVAGSVSMLGDWTKSSLDSLVGLDTVQQAHADFMQQYQDRITLASCFKDAEMHLVGAQTQAQRIQRSQLDMARTVVQMRNAQADLARVIAEGRRRVAAEQSRQRTSLYLDTWEDLTVTAQTNYQDAIMQYERALRLAQRTVYLAVRAVEYEWQKSDSARAQVLAATDPAQLDAILSDLQQEVGTNTINGQRAENMYVVVSLKEHLMQLADRSTFPAGQKTPSDSERLRAALTSPRYASYKADGTYAGQLVPFDVMPLGVLGLGTPGTIPLLTGSDCAERLWGVNAVVSGTNVLDGDATMTRVELWQRDTFLSQWCVMPAAGTAPMQSASVRPSRNLFKDPVWGAVSDSTGTAVRDASGFSKARLQAYLNVSRAEFEKESYAQGGSEELAARGLYGEYALFFPAEQLALGSGQGLHLERLDDVLLRFDYVSVAKSW